MSASMPKTQKAALVVKDDHLVNQAEELAPEECLIKMHRIGCRCG